MSDFPTPTNKAQAEHIVKVFDSHGMSIFVPTQEDQGQQKKPMRLQRIGLLISLTRRLGSRPPSVCKSAKDLLTAYPVGTSRKGALHGDA